MKQPVKRDHTILINGAEVTGKMYKKVVNSSARPADKEDLAQRPIHSVVRPFKILR